MVTASHNKATDNGLKVVDKGGEMLEESWEEIAVQLIALPSEEIPQFINSICISRGIDISVKGQSVFSVVIKENLEILWLMFSGL